jgi:RHS repeat-associated protein
LLVAGIWLSASDAKAQNTYYFDIVGPTQVCADGVTDYSYTSSLGGALTWYVWGSGVIVQNYGTSIVVRWSGSGSISANGSMNGEGNCWFNDTWPNYGWVCEPVTDYYYSHPFSVNPVSGGYINAPPRACGTASGSLSLLGSAGSVVRWESSTNLSSWTPISNVTTTLNYSGVTSTTHYRAVTNPGCIVYSSHATVLVDGPTVGGLLSPAGTVCAPSNSVSVTLSAHTGSVVRWEVSTTGSWLPITSTATTLNHTLTAESTQLRAWVANGACAGAASAVTTFVRLPQIPSYTTSGDLYGPITLTRGTPPANVIWYWQGTNPAGTSTANSSLTYEVVESGTYYLRARNSAGCWSSPFGLSVTVATPPCRVFGPTTGCAQQAYQFSTDCNTNGTWTVNGMQSGSGPALDHYFGSTGTYTVNYAYTEIVFVPEPDGPGYSTQTSFTVSKTIVIGPNITPVVTANRSGYCDTDPNTQVQLSVSNPMAGVTYQWASTPTGYSGTGTSLTANGVVNPTTFNVTATSASCSITTPFYFDVAKTLNQPTLADPETYHKRPLSYSGIYFGQHYWQTTAAGQSTDAPLGPQYYATRSGTYFVRRFSAAANCWSNPLSVNVTLTNFTPPVPVARLVYEPGYTEVYFFHDDRQHILTFADYFWVTSATSTSILRPYNEGLVTKGSRIWQAGTYYLRGRDKDTGTWGPALTLTITVRPDNSINSITTRQFDGTSAELTIAESKTYFDRRGKAMQTQTKNLAQNQVLAGQGIDDKQERSVGSTLTAPLGTTDFAYNPFFALAQDGTAYSARHFDEPGNRTNPQPLDQTVPGTLGYYYGAQNTDVTMPKTEFPYSRVDFYEDGTGEARKAAAPGNQFRMGQGREKLSNSFPVHNELNHYLTKRAQFVPGITTAVTTLFRQGVQQIVRDENKKYAVSISDKNGKTVFTARAGTSTNNVLAVTNQVTADVNAPLVYFYLLNPQVITLTGGVCQLENLETNTSFTYVTGSALAAGFYRLKWQSGVCNLTYTNHYLDVAYQFYDDAGRLVCSLSPNGFEAMEKRGITDVTQLDKTNYVYNHQGWLLSQTETDAGESKYMYRRDGKIRFSENALQRQRGRFSYTHYDALGRPIQSGEYTAAAYTFNSTALKGKLDFNSQEIWPHTGPSAAVTDWIRTTYDLPDAGLASLALPNLFQENQPYVQTFMRGAVSTTENANIKTWYSYDELGRVKWIIQKPSSLARVFILEYEYDFLGNVLKVGQRSVEGGAQYGNERFYHHYEYDRDKRLVKAYTSLNGVDKTLQAHYQYYLHGPLKRIELATNLQGIDFVYNIHGWLESINHPLASKDPGRDGQVGSPNAHFKADVFGLLLDYFDSEFSGMFPTADANTRDHLKIHDLPDPSKTEITPRSAVAWLPAFHTRDYPQGLDLRQYSAEKPHYRELLAQFQRDQQKIDLTLDEPVVDVSMPPVDYSTLTASLHNSPAVVGADETLAPVPPPLFDVVWTSLVGVTVQGTTITKTAATGWGTAGAVSQNILAASTDGYVEFTFNGGTGERVVGLSDVNTNANFNTIDYGFYYHTGTTASVFTNGTNRLNFTFQPGDMLRVERVGTSILFKRNGTTVFTQTGALTSALMVDLAINQMNTSLSYVRTSFWIPATALPNPQYDVVWTDLVGVSVNGNTITKTAASAWGNAGAASVNLLPANVDGWVEVTQPSGQTNGAFMFGFNDSNIDANFTSIDYAIHISNSIQGAGVYENGVSKGTPVPYTTGDIFRIERVGATVLYKKNGITFYTSLVSSSSALIADAAIFTSGYRVNNARASFWIPPAQGDVPDIWEFSALKALYDSLAGATWTTRTNWPAAGSWPATATSQQYGTWFGVRVVNGDVYDLNLPNNNLTGRIPQTIRTFKALRVLNFYNNKLSGPIPAVINQLTLLRDFNLGINNLLTGAIPDLSTLTSLTSFNLRNNTGLAAGPIPTWLMNFTGLTYLDLYGTKRNGSIPSNIGNLVNLVTLDLFGNQLTGSIPTGIGSLNKLAVLQLGANQLSGAIPSQICNLTSLNTLYLYQNQLTGAIPANIGQLSNLVHLAVYSNLLTGNLPSSLNQLRKLQTLNLYTNQFTGLWPYLGDLSDLQQLNLSSTPTYTPAVIPDWIGNLKKLTYLNLASTARTGSIPSSLANLTAISSFLLNDNALTGPVPTFITNFSALYYLFLFNNQLSGPLPQNWSGTPALYYIQLSGNRLTGAIPSSWLSIPALRIAYVHGNDFTSMPNFSTLSYRASMLIRVDNNRLDFTNLEPNFTGTNAHGFSYFVWSPQKTIADVAEVNVPVNTMLEVPARPFTANCTITWERETSPNVWTSVNASNQNTSQTSYRINTAATSHAGRYRYRVTSTRVTGFTSQSDPIMVTVTDVLNTVPTTSRALYNGNITALAWRTDPAYATNQAAYNGMYLYSYDDRYQIQEAQFANPNFAANTFALDGNRYRETGFAYDPNGNILKLKRYNQTQAAVHDFTYAYDALAKTNLISNSDASSTTGFAVYSGNGVNPTLAAETINGQNYVKSTVTNVSSANPGLQWSTAISVNAGEQYAFRVLGYRVSGTARAYLWVKPNNSATPLVWNSPASEMPNGAGNETWVISEFTVPAGVTSVNLGVLFNTATTLQAGNVVYVNKIEFYKVTTRSNRLTSVSGYVNAYTYNALGQMIGQDNVSGQDMYVDYDVSGKVTTVYRDAAKTKKTTVYKYDDRGFRLCKETYNTAGVHQFTTWYVRDASGNVVSIYNQTAGQALITLSEVPVYGSGKLGLARQQLGGGYEYIYELTDHLGNVRATLKKDEDVYLATMEDNGQATMSNPRVVEMTQFKNLFETERRDARMNKTANTVVPNPEWSAYLNWVDDGNPATKEDIIGPAIALKVEKGDQVNLEVWAKFERQVSYGRNATVAMMSTLLGGSFINASFGLETLSAANQAFNNSLPTALAGTGTDPATRPFAYLNYIVFDNSYVLRDAGAMRVPDAAGFNPGMEIAVAPQRVSFALPIEPQQTGYIYVWVSNETQGSKVWFDDLKVTHKYSRVTQATDFYAFGSVLREQKSPDDLIYRYGYQGNYSERDLETKWQHFELREFDPVVGRWTSKDPYGQYYSPYVGMGNNPVSGTDPDGGKNIKFDAGGTYIGTDHDVWWHNLLFGNRGAIVGANGEFTSTFRFADAQHDVADIENGTIDRLVFVTEGEITKMLGDAGAFKKMTFVEAIDYLKKEGVGGKKFDFSYSAIPSMYPGASVNPLAKPSSMLFLVDGVAHNHMNFGNFLFGAGGTALGVSVSALQLGAHYNSLKNSTLNGYPSQFDSSDDQFSIYWGSMHARREKYHERTYFGGSSLSTKKR